MDIEHLETQHELARRTLWIKVYVEATKQEYVNPDKVSDSAVNEFDRKFKPARQ